MADGAERVVREFEASIDRTLAATPFNIVVMGPALEDASPGGLLRRALIKSAKEYGPAVQPEHRGIDKSAREGLGAGYHLTGAEMFLVKASDLVVIIPASAGSLCELGFFSMWEPEAKKLLILSDKDYPKTGSYVADGPMAAAVKHGAKVHHVNYRDVARCWEIVRDRIEEIRVAKGLKRMFATE